MSEEKIIVLKRVRIGYPNVVTPYKGQEGKYSAKFYLEPGKHDREIREIREQMKSMIADDLKGVKLSPDRVCLKKGEDFGKTEFEEDKMILSANNNERPFVVAPDGKTEITDPRKIKGGNIVNAQITLWAQNHPDYGQRINANLVAVQFVKDDGMTFSTKAKPKMDAFEVLEDSTSGDDLLGDDFDDFDDDMPY